MLIVLARLRLKLFGFARTRLIDRLLAGLQRVVGGIVGCHLITRSFGVFAACGDRLKRRQSNFTRQLFGRRGRAPRDQPG